MRPTSISTYFYFGGTWRFLHGATKDYLIKGAGHILPTIDNFLHSLDTLGINVTKRTEAVSNLKKLRESLTTSSEVARLNESQASSLGKIMGDIFKTLSAELVGMNAYVVTEKRWDVEKLLNNVERLFPPSIFESLPDISKYDLAEAGKCIAFDRPTAAAFHLLRGTEAVLRHFYCSRIKRNRCQLLWGLIVKHLRDQKRPPDITLLNNLDNIKNSFRNPTQHPEMVYDIDAAQDLFGLCIDVINRMVRSLPTKKGS